MTKLQFFLRNSVIWCEVICAIAGIITYRNIKNFYWKWFLFYVIFICIAELSSVFILDNFPNMRRFYYDFFVIPLEFLFLYWLYAVKSLQQNKLFLFSCGIYITSFLPHLFYIEDTRIINSLSYTVGVLLLMVMIFLEFEKQIKSDSILKFRENRMFYVNVGVMLFYVGTLPFFTFDLYLYKNAFPIWSIYCTFFLIVANLMYLFFTASFIWGKRNT